MGELGTGRMATGVSATAILVLALTFGGYNHRAAARDGGLADGQYDCGGGYTYRSMGKVDIQGGQFRYRPYDKVVSGFAAYSVDTSGAIQWGGPFGELDDPPARIVTSTRET